MFNLSDMELSMLTLLMSSIVITIIGYSAHKSELVNPITAFVFTNLVGMGLLSTYAAWYNENIFDCSESQLSDAVWVHLIYGLAFVFGYLSRYNLISFVLRNLISFFSLGPTSQNIKLGARLGLISSGLLAFLMLFFSSPEGILWLTSPRDAYISLRIGFGQWWLLFQTSIALLFILTLFSTNFKERFYFKFSWRVLCFAGLMYFSGSKGAVLSILVVAGIYYHFYLHRLKILTLLIGGFLIVLTFYFLLGRRNYSEGLVGIITYFTDYISVSALIMDQTNIQGHTLGRATVSSLWYFVPRTLIEDKPFEYGPLLLHGYLFPGMAEKGHTPGPLPWVTFYIDFGVTGVVLFGIFWGSFLRAIYMEFLRTKEAGIFLLMTAFCFTPVVSSASSLHFIMMALFLWIVNGKRESCLIKSKDLNTNTYFRKQY